MHLRRWMVTSAQFTDCCGLRCLLWPRQQTSEQGAIFSSSEAIIGRIKRFRGLGLNSVLLRRSFSLTIHNDCFSMAGTVRGAITNGREQNWNNPCDGDYQLSLLQGLESRRRKTPGHVFEELTDGVIWGRKTHPNYELASSHWLRSKAVQEGENESSISIRYSLVSDCGFCVITRLSLLQWLLPLHDGLHPQMVSHSGPFLKPWTTTDPSSNNKLQRTLPLLGCFYQVFCQSSEKNN